MDFEYIVYTPMMELDLFFQEVDYVINILKGNGFGSIEMYYGWSWGEWESFDCNVNDIMTEIKKQEQISGDDFGRNDVYIVIKDLETRITFCHEADIHMEFNKANKVVSEVLTSWKSKELVHCVRKNKVDIEIGEVPDYRNT